MKKPRSKARAIGAVLMTGVFIALLVFFPLKKSHAQKEKERAAKKTAVNEAPKEPTTAKEKDEEKKEPTKGEAKAAEKVAENAEATMKGIPQGSGLPVHVGAALFFLELKSFDDTKGEFECSTDLRLRWHDLRLQYPATEAPRGYKEYRGEDAEAVLARIWSPNVEVKNRTETNGYVGRRIRIFPDGRVESIVRTTAKHMTKVDAERFPFDQQNLTLDLIVREDTTDEVVLEFKKEDIEFSRVARDAELDGWMPGLVHLKSEVVSGWNGDKYSRLVAYLSVERVATTGLAPIFIPLIASLLIPLLAVWMNRATEEGFEVEAFELANMGIGGLFSVIALSFAIYSSYGVIAGGDNTVTRLFGLNYVTLALSLSIVVLFFQYHVPRRLFGRYVEEQAFLYLSWAMPLLTLGTSIAFLLVAAV